MDGELSLSGAFALYPLAVQWAEEFRSIYPDVRVDISAGGAGKGMTDALAGVVDLGMVSREVYPPEEAKGAVGFAVAKDAVAATPVQKHAEQTRHGPCGWAANRKTWSARPYSETPEWRRPYRKTYTA